MPQELSMSPEELLMSPKETHSERVWDAIPQELSMSPEERYSEVMTFEKW